jgi:hypothetical protein
VDPDGKDWYSVLFKSRHQSSGIMGRVEHEAIVWIDPRGYGTTYERPAGPDYTEYVGSYGGSFANTRKGGKLYPALFRNLGPQFDPAQARRNADVGAESSYSTGRLQCTTYCAKLIGDRIFYDWGQMLGPEFMRDLPPHPNLEDRRKDSAYIPGLVVNGQMWPADLAPGVGGEFIEVTAPSTTHVFYPDARICSHVR